MQHGVCSAQRQLTVCGSIQKLSDLWLCQMACSRSNFETEKKNQALTAAGGVLRYL